MTTSGLVAGGVPAVRVAGLATTLRAGAERVRGAVDATRAFGARALLCTSGEAGAVFRAAAASVAGDVRGTGDVVGAGSADTPGDDTGARPALRRAARKPADATETAKAATAAAIKRDPEDITDPPV
jgi:hypothetical protein